ERLDLWAARDAWPDAGERERRSLRQRRAAPRLCEYVDPLLADEPPGEQREEALVSDAGAGPPGRALVVAHRAREQLRLDRLRSLEHVAAPAPALDVARYVRAVGDDRVGARVDQLHRQVRERVRRGARVGPERRP